MKWIRLNQFSFRFCHHTSERTLQCKIHVGCHVLNSIYSIFHQNTWITVLWDCAIESVDHSLNLKKKNNNLKALHTLWYIRNSLTVIPPFFLLPSSRICDGVQFGAGIRFLWPHHSTALSPPASAGMWKGRMSCCLSPVTCCRVCNTSMGHMSWGKRACTP